MMANFQSVSVILSILSGHSRLSAIVHSISTVCVLFLPGTKCAVTQIVYACLSSSDCELFKIKAHAQIIMICNVSSPVLNIQ